jgi:hypothetical protein
VGVDAVGEKQLCIAENNSGIRVRVERQVAVTIRIDGMSVTGNAAVRLSTLIKSSDASIMPEVAAFGQGEAKRSPKIAHA